MDGGTPAAAAAAAGGGSAAASSKKKKKRKSDAQAASQPAQATAAAAQQPAAAAATPGSSEKHKKKKHHKRKHEEQQAQQEHLAQPPQQQQQHEAPQQQEQQQQQAAGKKQRTSHGGGAAQQQAREPELQPPPEQPSSKKKKKKQQQQQQHDEQQQQQPKRKHAGEGGRAAKKQGGPVAVQVQVPGGGGVQPGAWLIHLAAPDPSIAGKLRFTAMGPRDAADPDKPLLLVSQQEGAMLIGSTHSNIQETGTEFERVALGIYDKQKHTLQLMRVAGDKIVRVEAAAEHAPDVQLAGLPRSQEQEAAEEAARQAVHAARPERDAAAKRAEARRLVEAFGSTRRKRQLQQRADGAVVVADGGVSGGGAPAAGGGESNLALLMEEVQARAAAAGDTREEVAARLAASRVIPAHNLLARTPEAAYRVRSMFPGDLMGALNSGQLLHASEKAEDRERLKSKGLVPAYVLSRLQRISDAASNAAEKKRRAKLLALLAALIQLANARSVLPLRPPSAAVPPKEDGSGGRPARPGGVAELAWTLKIGREEVAQQLLDMFYYRKQDEGRPVYAREASKLQLLLMHVLVVALAVEGWKMAPQQFEGLRKELRMTAADVASRFRELGCTASAVKLAPASVLGQPPGDKPASTTAYSVALLQDGKKTLGEALPKPKSGPKQRAGR